MAYSKKLDLKPNSKQSRSNGESPNVHRRPEKRDKHNKGHSKSRSKSRAKNINWLCHKEGHFKKSYPLKKEREFKV